MCVEPTTYKCGVRERERGRKGGRKRRKGGRKRRNGGRKRRGGEGGSRLEVLHVCIVHVYTHHVYIYIYTCIYTRVSNVVILQTEFVMVWSIRVLNLCLIQLTVFFGV